MAILKNTMILTALSLMFTGCYEDFNPNIDTKPVLCLNSLITAGEPIEVEVTHTWIYSEGWASSVDVSVKDAEIYIYANDVHVTDEYIPQEGDRIRIVADSKTYGTAEAEVVVPYAVRDADMEYSATLVSVWQDNHAWEMNSDITFDVSINLTLKDSPKNVDYYKLDCSAFMETGDDFNPDGSLINYPAEFYKGTFDEKSEPIFSEHIGVFESVMGTDAYGVTFFTDRQFSGKSYTLHLRFTNANFNVRNPVYDDNLLDCGYILELHSISPSYYNWLNYEWQTDNDVTGDINDFGFGDPMWGYSNVSTGAGVVAAQSSYMFTIDLKEFLKTTLNNK